MSKEIDMKITLYSIVVYDKVVLIHNFINDFFLKTDSLFFLNTIYSVCLSWKNSKSNFKPQKGIGYLAMIIFFYLQDS